LLRHHVYPPLSLLIPSFLIMLPPPPCSTLFPYTTLFRSSEHTNVHNPALRPVHLHVTLVSGGRQTDGQRHSGWPETLRSDRGPRSEEHTSELQSRFDLVCRLLLEKKKKENESNDNYLVTD